MAEPQHVTMEDFIFGTLATDDLRVKALIAERNGLSHHHQANPRNPDPGQAVKIEATAGPDAPVRDVFLHFTTDGSTPTLENEKTQTIPLAPLSVDWDTLLWGYSRRYAGLIPGQSEGVIVRYRISGVTHDGKRLWAENGKRFSYSVDKFRSPEWVHDAVIYQIFMDRFAPSPGKSFADHTNLSDFYGGTLPGVLDKLDYLSELGVNTLWLSPIYPSPTHHGYDATDFHEVNPRFGTKADLKALIDEVHRRGMHLILDFVPNHISNEHPHFVSAQQDAASPYRDFFTFDRWPDDYRSFFAVKSMPEINNNHPAARRYVIDSALYWMQEFGVDGFRLDYANGPSHDFWTDYYAAVKSANADSFHFGEIVETPALLRSYRGVMDGTLDFNWLQMARKLFAFGTADAAQFEQFLSAHESYFSGSGFDLPNFLDNHDMNRFLWVTRGDKRRLMLAAVCQFTLSGPPVIYYGTEVGLSQLRDARQGSFGIPEESRQPMIWGDEQDRGLFAFYQQLIKIRQESVALCHGPRNAYIVDPDTGRYGYLKQSEGEAIIVLMNIADTAQRFDLPAGNWRDAWNGGSLSGSVELDAFGYLIARQEDQ